MIEDEVRGWPLRMLLEDTPQLPVRTLECGHQKRSHQCRRRISLLCRAVPLIYQHPSRILWEGQLGVSQIDTLIGSCLSLVYRGLNDLKKVSVKSVRSNDLRGVEYDHLSHWQNLSVCDRLWIRRKWTPLGL